MSAKVGMVMLSGLLVLGLHQRGCLGQDDPIGCYVEGECLFSFFLAELPMDTAYNCLSECKELEECSFFTHYVDEEVCQLLQNCEEFSNSTCDSCISGDASCTDDLCFVDGVSCQGIEVDIGFDLTSPEECLGLCQDTDGCSWFTYDAADGTCILTESCPSYRDCEECTIGASTCSDGGGGEDDVLTIMIVAGFNSEEFDDLDDVEVVILSSQGPSGVSNCIRPSNIPYMTRGNIGLTDDQDRPMTCGGFNEPDPSECIAYVQDTDLWVPSQSTMTSDRDYSATALLTGGNYLVAGGSANGGSTYEFYERNSGTFVEGSQQLPVTISAGCAVEITPGTVFIADGGLAYSFDVATETFTSLPDIPVGNSSPTCGMALSPLGGKDIVVLGGIDVPLQIYNTLTEEWRESAFELDRDYTAAVQYRDTFVITGGGRNNESINDDIFEYDPVSESLVLRNEKLAVPRWGHAAIIVDNGYCIPT